MDMTTAILHEIKNINLTGAFFNACIGDHKKYFYELIDNPKVNINHVGMWQKTPLKICIGNLNYEFVEALLERGAKIEYNDIEMYGFVKQIIPETKDKIRKLLNLYKKLQE